MSGRLLKERGAERKQEKLEVDTSKSEDLEVITWEKVKAFSLNMNLKALL